MLASDVHPHRRRVPTTACESSRPSTVRALQHPYCIWRALADTVVPNANRPFAQVLWPRPQRALGPASSPQETTSDLASMDQYHSKPMGAKKPQWGDELAGPNLCRQAEAFSDVTARQSNSSWVASHLARTLHANMRAAMIINIMSPLPTSRRQLTTQQSNADPPHYHRQSSGQTSAS
jgi:hypothetical protein